MFYYPTDGRVFKNHSEIRWAFTYVLFPPEITPDMLEYLEIYPLVYEMPEVGENQIAEPTEVLEIDGQWVQQWAIRDAEPEDPPVDPEPEEPVQSDN